MISRHLKLIHRILTGYAIVLLAATALTMTIEAQNLSQVSTLELERRVSNLENLHLDRRLTVLETRLEEVSKGLLDYMTPGGVALLLLKHIYDATARKKDGHQ
jgi:hypothetical protein